MGLCCIDTRLKGKLLEVITQKQKDKNFFLRVCAFHGPTVAVQHKQPQLSL